MRCWGDLKSLRGQSVGEVRLVTRAVFRICGNEGQPDLQIVEKLATPLQGIPLSSNDCSSGCASDSHILTYLTFLSFIAPYPPPSI